MVDNWAIAKVMLLLYSAAILLWIFNPLDLSVVVWACGMLGILTSMLFDMAWLGYEEVYEDYRRK